MSKKFCVHVYPAYHEYEDIEAETPEQAEDFVLRANFYQGEDVSHVEVMRQCECGLDNDVMNEECEDCGEKL